MRLVGEKHAQIIDLRHAVTEPEQMPLKEGDRLRLWGEVYRTRALDGRGTDLPGASGRGSMELVNPVDADPSLSAATLAAHFARLLPMQHLPAPDALTHLANHWCERQRCWHGPAHALNVLESAAQIATASEHDALTLAAAYHDAIYDPRARDNEEASAALLLRHAADPTHPDILRAVEIIRDSAWSAPPATKLGRAFFELDTYQLSESCPTAERFRYERAIFREYQWVPWREYRVKRAEFLRGWAEKFPQHRRGALECIELLAAMSPRFAVYPGSFNPFHLGHLSVLRQAERTFDKVIVALGVNRQKLSATDSLETRRSAMERQLKFHETTAFDGLLSRYLDDLGETATVVRGVRDGTDLEAELRYARFLDELRPGTAVVWISCEPVYQHLSSSAMRELSAIEPGAERRYLPTAAQIYGLTEPPVT